MQKKFVNSTIDLKCPKRQILACIVTFALDGGNLPKHYQTFKICNKNIKTVLENDRSIRNFGNIPKTEGKSARWVSQVFSGTKD